MKLNDLNLFPIKNDDRYEDFCLDVFRIDSGDSNTQRNGRRGQRQNGVDIFFHTGYPLEWSGIQCKVRNKENSLTIKEIENEVSKAKDFVPKLSRYIIVTTEPRDAGLQEEVRKLDELNVSRNMFSVRIEFWEDMLLRLSEEKFKEILFKYYSEFVIDSKKYGRAVGRLVTIFLGVEDDYITQYELLISKIPMINDQQKYGIYHFQDRYVVSNLNNKAFDIIRQDCHPGDLRHAIDNAYDRHLVAKWLRNANIDDIIYSDQDVYFSSFATKKEEQEFNLRMQD